MINRIVEVIATITDVVFMVWFIPMFLKRSLKQVKNIWKYVLPVVFLIFQLVADKLFRGFDIGATLTVFIISLLFSICVCEWKRNGFGTILASCLYMSVLMFSGSIVYSIFSFFINGMDVVMQGAFENERIIYIVVSLVVRFFLFKLILIVFKSNDKLDRKSGIFVLLSFLFLAIGLGVLMYISIKSTNVPDSSVLLLTVIMTASNVALYFTVFQMEKLKQKQYEYRLIKERLALAQINSDEATKIWENIRKVRHEMKNHLTVLAVLLKKQDIEGCETYLSNLIGNVEHFGDIVRTDNAVIDYLINSKLTCLKDTKIIVSGYVGNFDDISDADLACMIGNVIDNAVEAENKIQDHDKRIIELHFLVQNQNRIIVCKNAIEESVLDTNKELRTTKKDTISHGLGHQIISEIAEKYYGFVNYSEVNDMFCVQIVLPRTL